ncbi:hypothetical protein QR680_018865 [Steinernema hermaphroditum]|uniref:Putative alpha-L-fucosidase n=1 Tax=Steinernema hermaphroditum TaxID=289476 RepID=A0AA39LRP3_9BILA|nr:hypothetical protein QR680_018865 [Steinernema hermaphroditum]
MLVPLIIFLFGFSLAQKYEPTWASIDSRPLPQWYDEAKFGIFCHWGVYSVPAFKSEWFWNHWKGSPPDEEVVEYVEKNYPPGFSYADFGHEFRAQDFNASHFVELVKSSHARYFVFTSKHHEGFTMWPSAESWNWNSVDVGPHRDIVGELKTEFSKTDIHFGLYFSQYEWFHPYYLQNNTNLYPERVSYPQMVDIVKKYGPEVIWSDGDWDRTDEYWRSKEFLAWLYNESPVKNRVVVNDRWGRGIMGQHGGFLTYSDHFDPGHLLARKWENCLTLDVASWGHRRSMKAADVRTTKDLITQLARTISCGGNMLLNFGPDRFGNVAPIFEERLRNLGKWVETNEEAIFGSKPWIYQNDSDSVWYTSKLRSEANSALKNPIFNYQNKADTVIYAFVLDVPSNGLVKLTSVTYTKEIKISLLGSSQLLKAKKETQGITVDVSVIPWKALASTESIVLKIEHAASDYNVNPIKKLQRLGLLDREGRSVNTLAF